jgi:hypothetical protein
MLCLLRSQSSDLEVVLHKFSDLSTILLSYRQSILQLQLLAPASNNTFTSTATTTNTTTMVKDEAYDSLHGIGKILAAK